MSKLKDIIKGAHKQRKKVLQSRADQKKFHDNTVDKAFDIKITYDVIVKKTYNKTVIAKTFKEAEKKAALKLKHIPSFILSQSTNDYNIRLHTTKHIVNNSGQGIKIKLFLNAKEKTIIKHLDTGAVAIKNRHGGYTMDPTPILTSSFVDNREMASLFNKSLIIDNIYLTMTKKERDVQRGLGILPAPMYVLNYKVMKEAKVKYRKDKDNGK